MAGKPTPKPRKPAASRVTRAKPAPTVAKDPGPKGTKAILNSHATPKPGMSGGKTRATGAPFPAKSSGTTTVPMRPGRGVRDQAAAATGQSVFDRADAGNRRLGRRNRT